MKTKNTLIGFALDKNNKIIHIKDANRGFGHGYTCPICKKELGAKKGEVKEHHFAHKSGETHGGESVIHYVAKYRLAELILEGSFEFKKAIQLTALQSGICELNYRNSEKMFITHLDKRPIDYLEPSTVIFTDAKVESSLSPELRPDVKVVNHDGEFFGLEVFVTHDKDDWARHKYKDLDISCLEIDLSHLSFNATNQEIDNALNDIKRHRWLNISENLKLIQQLKTDFLESEQVKDWLANLEERLTINKAIDKVKKQRGLNSQSTNKSERVKQFEKMVERENAELRARWEGKEVGFPQEVNQRVEKQENHTQKKHNPQTVVIRSKPIKHKRIKVKFVKSYPPYRSGQITEIDEELAQSLMKEFIVKPL